MENKKGFLYAILAFFLWGLYPLYWNLLGHIAPTEILANRMIWSFAMLGIFILMVRKSQALGTLVKGLNWKRSLLLVAAAALLSTNWLVYTWAVSHGRVLYASLGYYINPLVSILMGVLLLKEKLTRPQLVAMVIAAGGVLFLTVNLGVLPWISLVLALTFATYGLVKKLLKMDAVFSLFLETALMFPFAMLYVGRGFMAGQTAHNVSNITTAVLLVGGGFVTIVPLFLFNKATQLIPLKYVGFIQYIAPTLGFLLSVFVFGEAVTNTHLITFAFIWTACLIFAGSQFSFKGGR